MEHSKTVSTEPLLKRSHASSSSHRVDSVTFSTPRSIVSVSKEPTPRGSLASDWVVAVLKQHFLRSVRPRASRQTEDVPPSRSIHSRVPLTLRLLRIPGRTQERIHRTCAFSKACFVHCLQENSTYSSCAPPTSPTSSSPNWSGSSFSCAARELPAAVANGFTRRGGILSEIRVAA